MYYSNSSLLTYPLAIFNFQQTEFVLRLPRLWISITPYRNLEILRLIEEISRIFGNSITISQIKSLNSI